MDVFISHITEESEVAKALRGYIENSLAYRVRFFISSDSVSIPAGTKWLDKMTKAITNSKVILLLCSANSINRPWINFEAGCGWAQVKPIIPICYGRLSLNDLPPPINALQGFDLEQGQPHGLIGSLSKYLDNIVIPQPNDSEMYEEIMFHVRAIAKNTGAAQVSNLATSSAENELDEEHLKILKFLGKHKHYPSLMIGQEVGLSSDWTGYYLRKLEKKRLIRRMETSAGINCYALTDKGRDVHIEHGEIYINQNVNQTPPR